MRAAVAKPTVKNFVKKIISNKQLNFKETASRVYLKNKNKDNKHSIKKNSKLKEFAKKVAKSNSRNKYNMSIKISNDSLKKFHRDNIIAKKDINKMVDKISEMAEDVKKHGSKKTIAVKKATLNKVYDSFQQSILESAEKLHLQSEVLEEVRYKMSQNHGSKSGRDMRKVDRLLKEILTFLSELQKASENVQNVFIKLNK
jgi:hypothetical protein